MGALIVYTLLGFMGTELIFKNERNKPTALPVVTGFLCGFAYNLFHRAVMINGTQEQAIIAGLIFSVGLFVITFGIAYYLYKSNKKEIAIKTEKQSDLAERQHSYQASTYVTPAKTLTKLRPLLKNWIIPAVILCLILGACAFRYEQNASKSLDSYVIKWTTDRWTGDKWMTVYGPEGVYETPLTGSNESWEMASNTMRAIAAIDITWLLYALYLTRLESAPKDID